MRMRAGFWSWLRGEWVALAGLALLVVFGIGLTREVARRQALDTELRSLQADVGTLAARRDELQSLIAEFQRAETQEQEARLKLNLAKPGERSLIVERTPSNATSTEESTPALSRSIPTRWWQYFFGSV